MAIAFLFFPTSPCSHPSPFAATNSGNEPFDSSPFKNVALPPHPFSLLSIQFRMHFSAMVCLLLGSLSCLPCWMSFPPLALGGSHPEDITLINQSKFTRINISGFSHLYWDVDHPNTMKRWLKKKNLSLAFCLHRIKPYGFFIRNLPPPPLASPGRTCCISAF